MGGPDDREDPAAAAEPVGADPGGADPGGADVAGALTTVSSHLPHGGEDRPGQRAMADAVARAVALGRHLVVQAGTGTGKSLAYLVPLALSGRRTVVATATKALQDQLATKDLPLVAAHLDRTGRALRVAVLKGRANYICRQRVAEVSGREGEPVPEPGAEPVSLFEPAGDDAAGPAADVAGAVADMAGLTNPNTMADQLRALLEWADRTTSGDRGELSFEPHPRAWAAVSVTSRECPGAFRCPSGPDCFAEHARARAAAADIVVVNTHLYATHVASDGAVLPEHEVVVFDEAHAVEEIMTAGLGVELTSGRLRAASAAAKGLVADDDAPAADAVSDAGDRLQSCLRARVGRRVLRGHGGTEDDELLAVLELAAGRVRALIGALRRTAGAESDASLIDTGAELAPRRARALLAAAHVAEDLDALLGLDAGRVAWVEGQGPGGRQPVLRAAPVEVDPVLRQRLWPAVTAVLTSATIPPLLRERLGLPRQDTDELDVGSPFPYREHALLYCPTDLPDRRSPGAEAALHRELGLLVGAAGGRTLALFTSWRAMGEAVEALRPRLPFTVLAQNDLPKQALLDAFVAEETSCLFATMSFWQGVDVPGSSLRLVVLDRLPFPRPDDPLLEARRELAGDDAFRLVDLPRAATLLAQGAGRLIRRADDWGVVAVLDRRLATAGYGRTLRQALPPMRFTTDRSVATGFLQSLDGSSVP